MWRLWHHLGFPVPPIRTPSTVALHPYDEDPMSHDASRFCPLRQAPEGSTAWNHVGFPSLRSLVDWVGLEPR